VVIETNAYTITLIFADLVIAKLSDHIDPGLSSRHIPLK
jgi:hypothetical protein